MSLSVVRRAIVAGVLLAMLSAPAMAQVEDCPPRHVCVTYANDDGSVDVFEIDTAMGHYQEIVVEVRSVEVQNLSGTTKEWSVVLAPYLLGDGDTYTLLPLRTVEREGIYADADLRDVYILVEAD